MFFHGRFIKLLLHLLATSFQKNESYKWLIVGGGIHGVHIATRLLHQQQQQAQAQQNDILDTIASPSSSMRIAIVDPHPTLLHQWKQRSAATGMTYMRSSASFHLDVHPHALRRFAVNTHGGGGAKGKKTKKRKKVLTQPRKQKRQVTHHEQLFTNDYERPSLELFNDHCDSILQQYQLQENSDNDSQQQERHIRGVVTSMKIVNMTTTTSRDDTKQDDDDALGQDVVQVVVIQETSKGEPRERVIAAEHVVLALGSPDPHIPSWAAAAAEDEIGAEYTSSSQRGTGKDQHIEHIFENGTMMIHPSKDEKTTLVTMLDGGDKTSTTHGPLQANSRRRVAIVGGGISTVHKALSILKERQSNHVDTISRTTVDIISRHPLRIQQFDTHQDWMMDEEACRRTGVTPACIQRFRQLGQEDRRAVIAKERTAGTVHASLGRGGELQNAIRDGHVIWHVADIHHVEEETQNDRDVDPPPATSSTKRIHLSSGETLTVDQVILATGFENRPPGGAFIQQLAETANLPLSSCGYPIVDTHLRWHPRIFVSGGLADLELGPSARNIAGARLAAERITAAPLY